MSARRLAFLSLVLFLVSAFPARAERSLEQRRAIAWRAVVKVFGPDQSKIQDAWGVVGCETGHTYRLKPQAHDGQYHGLFQMGTWERKTYAHGRYRSAVDQARAAKRYNDATGGNFVRWQCKPDGTLRW